MRFFEGDLWPFDLKSLLDSMMRFRCWRVRRRIEIQVFEVQLRLIDSVSTKLWVQHYK